MLTGLYSAGTAMDAAARNHELIAQNLAHAQMPGYRRQALRNKACDSQFDGELANAINSQSRGEKSGEVTTDFTPGALEQTEGQLDVALQGDGFFVVNGPEGPLYTRNGSFHLDADGQLMTADGLPVQGKDGEITIPSDAPYGSIQITKDGSVYAKGNQVGQLEIVSFENPQQLTKAGITLFAAPSEARPIDSEAVVAQGYRERSNVSPVQELVDLIQTQRRQEAAQRSMNSLSESVGKHISTQGGV
jgi:flagellar basal body rod protein FlgG